MGKNNQQRRAAKRKKRAAGRQAPTVNAFDGPAAYPAGSTGSRTADELATALVAAGVQAVGSPPELEDAIGDLLMFGGTGAPADAQLGERTASRLLLEWVGRCYEGGWQPADLVHVARRELGVRPGRLAGDVVAVQAVAERAFERAPTPWLEQLEVFAHEPTAVAAGSTGWNAVRSAALRRTNDWDAWHAVLLLLSHLGRLPAMPRLVPPPSTWGRHRVAQGPTVAAGSGHHHPKKLSTIRALLAKAEATEFSEEADAFTAKAQDLMTRYAIDEALLSEGADGVEIRSSRVHIDNPYASTKAQLLNTVGQVNRAKTIWDELNGIATIVGLPVDLDLTEMLFTSLLVQATKAMTEAGAVSTGGHRLDRSPSFRRAFLLSYADRIGERLSDAGRHAQREEAEHRGRDLLPVLARQSAAVDTEFARLFPRATQSGATRVDARGWHAGRAAADRAVLAKAQVHAGSD